MEDVPWAKPGPEPCRWKSQEDRWYPRPQNLSQPLWRGRRPRFGPIDVTDMEAGGNGLPIPGRGLLGRVCHGERLGDFGERGCVCPDTSLGQLDAENLSGL